MIYNKSKYIKWKIYIYRMNMNNLVVGVVFIAISLFVVFGIFPTYMYCSHLDQINHDRYVNLEYTASINSEHTASINSEHPASINSEHTASINSSV